MRPTRLALGFIAALFIAAEIVRPTRVPAKKSSRALVVPTQVRWGTGRRVSLDPNLLDDLPRIHPDAVGYARCSRRRDGSFRIVGTIDAEDAGSAVFVVRDGSRLATETEVFGDATRPRQFAIVLKPSDLGVGKHRLAVALVSSDQRGFSLLPQTTDLTVREPSHELDATTSCKE